MTVQSDSNRGRVTAAALAASFVMLASGATFYCLAARLDTPTRTMPLDAQALNEVPLEIGDWVGQDTPVDEELANATGADAYINRRYWNQRRAESVSLFAACGTNVDEVMSHRPLGCYRAAGWTLVNHHPMELSLENGQNTLPCTVYEFYRTGLADEKVTVLHYCRADGQYFDEVMQVLAQGWGGMRRVGYAAQIQIVASSQTLRSDAEKQLVCDFARASAAPLARVLEEIEEGLAAREDDD